MVRTLIVDLYKQLCNRSVYLLPWSSYVLKSIAEGGGMVNHDSQLHPKLKATPSIVHRQAVERTAESSRLQHAASLSSTECPSTGICPWTPTPTP